jgi:hypothetical protein
MYSSAELISQLESECLSLKERYLIELRDLIDSDRRNLLKLEHKILIDFQSNLGILRSNFIAHAPNESDIENQEFINNVNAVLNNRDKEFEEEWKKALSNLS